MRSSGHMGVVMRYHVLWSVSCFLLAVAAFAFGRYQRPYESTESTRKNIATGDGYQPKNFAFRKGEEFHPQGTGANSKGELNSQVPPPPVNADSSYDRERRDYIETSYHSEAHSMFGESRSLTTSELALSVGSLVFILAGMGLACWMRIQKAITGEMWFKVFGLVTVIGSSLFLIASGWSQQQIIPIVGILGTSLGVVFGKTETRAKRIATSRKPPSKKTVSIVSTPAESLVAPKNSE